MFYLVKPTKLQKQPSKLWIFLDRIKSFFTVSSLLAPTHFFENTTLYFARYSLGSVLSKFGGFRFIFWDLVLIIIHKLYDSPITIIIFD